MLGRRVKRSAPAAISVVLRFSARSPMTELSKPAVDLIIVPPSRDLGGFQVRRALPNRQRQMVGPFIFLDQIGPAQFAAGEGIDVRPHPHIGLATVTYLFEGSLMHRDSEGNQIEISPGAMNLM